MKFSYSQERILNEWEVQSLVSIQRGFSLFDGDLAKQQIDNNQFLWSLLLSTTEMTSKCSKLKWNHELQASGFTTKLTVYDVHLR